MNDGMPDNPFSQLMQVATSVHELFESYKAAGFTEQQALYLVACQVCGGPKEQR